jgi:glycosyltransferase involved in cell wall biosynthesis
LNVNQRFFIEVTFVWYLDDLGLWLGLLREWKFYLIDSRFHFFNIYSLVRKLLIDTFELKKRLVEFISQCEYLWDVLI